MCEGACSELTSWEAQPHLLIQGAIWMSLGAWACPLHQAPFRHSPGPGDSCPGVLSGWFPLAPALPSSSTSFRAPSCGPQAPTAPWAAPKTSRRRHPPGPCCLPTPALWPAWHLAQGKGSRTLPRPVEQRFFFNSSSPEALAAATRGQGGRPARRSTPPAALSHAILPPGSSQPVCRPYLPTGLVAGLAVTSSPVWPCLAHPLSPTQA